MSSGPFANIPLPVFADNDPTPIAASIISGWEAAETAANPAAAPLTLAPGDPRHTLALFWASIIAQAYAVIQYTGEQGLLAFATGTNLDNLGANWGDLPLPNGVPSSTRLAASFSTTSLTFTLSVAQPSSVTVPQGTIVSAGAVQFATTQPGVIPTGSLTVSIPAQAVIAGAAANNYVAGQINSIVSWNPSFAVTAVNTTTSSGGSDAESDAAYAERIYLLPPSLSRCGPKGEYEFWARSTNPAIIDAFAWSSNTNIDLTSSFPAWSSSTTYSGTSPASVVSYQGQVWVAAAPVVGEAPGTVTGHWHMIRCFDDRAGIVFVNILMTGGAMPTTSDCNAVSAVLNGLNVRPLAEQVIVQAPTPVSFTLSVGYSVLASQLSNLASIQAAVATAVQAWINNIQLNINQNIDPSTLIAAIVNAGGVDVSVTSPSSEVVLTNGQIGQCTSQAVTYNGTVIS